MISLDQVDISLAPLVRMTEAMAHRGPDGYGHWISPKGRAGLGHRRLSILDLSPAAAQPMHLLDRYSIVHNGEIYNYRELRTELQKAGYPFRTQSDTEVILAAYDCYKENCLQHFDGMFAFAIWDEYEQELFAARDRFGEKPFYYHLQQDRLIFASEMKGLWAAGVPRRPDSRMLTNYLALGYVQNASDKALTFFKDIYALPPAHRLHVRKGKLSIQRYWHIDKQAIQHVPEKEACSYIEALLKVSVARRLRSDVPVGTSLSGGIDSASIAALVRGIRPELNAFSAVFPGFERDESAAIRQLRDHWQLSGATVQPQPDELIRDFETLCHHQEEPFSSSSVYAQYRVYQLARQHGVKVLLDGQGADELFAGYNRYVHWYLQEMVSRYRFHAAYRERKTFAAQGVDLRWDIRNWLAAYLPSHVSIALEKRSFQHIQRHPDLSAALISTLKGREWEGLHKPIVTKLNDILHFDVAEMGLEELLRYADRNAMAHGTEVRLPFLFHELATYVFSLPSRYKIRNGFTKYILRQIMEPYLPEQWVWRAKKIAFEPPQKSWMENPRLKEYLHESKRVLVYHDILRPEALQRKYRALDAYEPNNYDWRYLCAAKLFE